MTGMIKLEGKLRRVRWLIAIYIDNLIEAAIELVGFADTMADLYRTTITDGRIAYLVPRLMRSA